MSPATYVWECLSCGALHNTFGKPSDILCRYCGTFPGNVSYTVDGVGHRWIRSRMP